MDPRQQSSACSGPLCAFLLIPVAAIKAVRSWASDSPPNFEADPSFGGDPLRPARPGPLAVPEGNGIARISTRGLKIIGSFFHEEKIKDHFAEFRAVY